jgi:hypothetical protein
MAENFILPRPNSAQGFYGVNDVMRRMYNRTVQATTPAAAAALPQVSGVVQEFTSADRYAQASVCAGTILTIGTDSVGFLIVDSPVSTTAAYALDGVWRCQLNGGVTAAVGTDAYIILATKLVTTASGAGNLYLGKFTSANLTDPSGLPAGTYADVAVNQGEA